MAILVIFPADVAPDIPTSEGVALVAYRSAEDVIAALTSAADAAVLVSDSIGEPDLAAVARSASRCAFRVIEVRTLGWDGVTESVLSAACRGVIAGFGLAGIQAALSLLGRESAARR